MLEVLRYESRILVFKNEYLINKMSEIIFYVIEIKRNNEVCFNGQTMAR